MIPFRKPAPRERLIVTALAVVLALVLAASGALGRGDRVVYDALLQWSDRGESPASPVIVAIDARSLARLGRWPWSRDVHAALLDRLTEADARAVGLDLLFAEPSADPATDERLAEAIARNGRVVLPVLAESERLGGPLKETLPIPVLASAAAALGHVDLELGPDGIVRTTFGRAGLGGADWPGFPLALARLASGTPVTAPAARLRPGPGAVPVTWVRADPIMIPFRGAPGTFPRLSYSDVLEGRVPAELLRGQVVLVGATAAGIGDALPTPLSGRSLPMSGVEVLANIHRGIMDGTLVRPMSPEAALLVTLLAVLLPLLLYPYTGWRRCALLAAMAAVAPLAASAGLLWFAGLWWAPTAALAGSTVGFALWAWRRSDSTRSALDAGRRQAEVTLRSIADGIVTTDARQRITYMNPVAETLTGYPASTATGLAVTTVLPLVDRATGEPAMARVASAMNGDDPVSLDDSLEIRLPGGEFRGVDLTVSRVRDSADRPAGWVFALRDVTRARALSERVAYQANHDVLTDLPNRALLRDRLVTALARARRAGRRLGVVCVDMDRFKSVNDSFGHDFGDRLLIAVASRLSEAARGHDTVARTGGDEFVVIFEDMTDTLDVSTLARRLREELARPLKVGDQDLLVTASFGVSLFPRDAGDAEDLMRNAAAALDRAKESGRNTVRFYSEDMNRVVRRRAGLERALRRAVESGGEGLSLFYQPIVSLADGRVTGNEALLRWTDVDYGQVDPEEFISVAEESGLIASLGEWVMHTACRQAREWRDNGVGTLRMSVNLSPRQLANQDVPKLVSDALEQAGIDAAQLEVEITESVMVHDVERNAEALRAVKALGVRIAVDDFGTGYSSLSFLKRFPVDRVKIDRSFVHDIGTNRESTAIVNAVLAMARSLSLEVVAEGIEKRSHLEFMSDGGCHEGQGFFLARPASAGDIGQRLRDGGDLRAG